MKKRKKGKKEKERKEEGRQAIDSWNFISNFKKDISLNEKEFVAGFLGLHLIELLRLG